MPAALGLTGIGGAALLAHAAAGQGAAAFAAVGTATMLALALYGIFVIAAPADRQRLRRLWRTRAARGT